MTENAQAELTCLQRAWCMAILVARRIEDAVDDRTDDEALTTSQLAMLYAELTGHTLLIHQAEQHASAGIDLETIIRHHDIWHLRHIGTFPALLRHVRTTALGLWPAPDTFRLIDWQTYYKAAEYFRLGEWDQAALLAGRLRDCHGKNQSDWFSRIRYTALSGMPLHTPI